MLQFKNVTVDAKVNVYFDGKVTSTQVTMEDGSHKTIGVMMPGEYTFETELAEDMHILSGTFYAKLPGETEFKRIDEDSHFFVAAKSRFEVQIDTMSNYVCSYLAN